MTRQRSSARCSTSSTLDTSSRLPKLVEAEFNNIWNQVNRDLEQAGRTFEDEDTTEEEARAEYRSSPSAACGLAWCSQRSARRPA